MATVIRGDDNFDTADNATQTELDSGLAGKMDSSATTGKVLQVVHATASTELNSTTTAYVDTALQATITPSSASSKILCRWTMPYNVYPARGFGVKLLRNTTTVYMSADQYENYYNGTSNIWAAAHWERVDTPASTSALTYKVQVGNYSTGNMEYMGNGMVATITLMEISG